MRWRLRRKAVAWIALALTGSAGGCGATERSESEIRTMLDDQVRCWNAGDFDGFMNGYWRSDSLTFSSGGKTTRGWESTRTRYYERYPDRAAMGRLSFDELEIHPLDRSAALTLGHWHLEREGDNVGGNFSLVLQRFAEGWLIIHDHTSVRPEE